MRFSWIAAAVAGAALVASAPARAQVVALTDGTFNDADWSFVVVNNTTNGTPTSYRSAFGNPAPARTHGLMASTVGAPVGVDEFSFRGGFSYHPAAQGAIAGWAFTIDHM